MSRQEKILQDNQLPHTITDRLWKTFFLRQSEHQRQGPEPFATPTLWEPFDVRNRQDGIIMDFFGSRSLIHCLEASKLGTASQQPLSMFPNQEREISNVDLSQ